MKRILIAYFPRPPIGEYLKRAFEKRGVTAEVFHSDVNNWFDRYVIHYTNKMAHNLRLLPKSKVLFRDHPLSHLNFRSRKFLERVREFRPDLVLIIRGWRFTREVLREVRKTSKIFGWWIEREERMAEPFREIETALFDHYFFMNSSCVEEGRKKGFDGISLLHHSVDTAVFRPVASEKNFDWSFVGRWSKKRQEYIEKAVTVSERGAVYGPGWRAAARFNGTLRRALLGDYIEGEAMARLYSESRVVLNITNWGFGEGDKRSGMNMRVLEVPACRTCLLTDGSRDMERLVTPGEHLVVYEGIEDFAEKLDYYIKNENERENLAERGYRHVLSKYTYDDVADIIARKYEEKSAR